MDSAVIDEIYSDCCYDTCVVGDTSDGALCEDSEELVELCWNRYGVDVGTWRDEQFCRMYNVT